MTIQTWTKKDGARCSIFTYKEGLFSKFAHDLELSANTFSITYDSTKNQIEAEFSAGDIGVLCAVNEGKKDSFLLSDHDKKQIEENIRSKVLESDRYPLIKLHHAAIRAEPLGFYLEGELELRGVLRPWQSRVLKKTSTYELAYLLSPSSFGIKPFSAMFGALKIQDRVQIAISVPIR